MFRICKRILTNNKQLSDGISKSGEYFKDCRDIPTIKHQLVNSNYFQFGNPKYFRAIDEVYSIMLTNKIDGRSRQVDGSSIWRKNHQSFWKGVLSENYKSNINIFLNLYRSIFLKTPQELKLSLLVDQIEFICAYSFTLPYYFNFYIESPNNNNNLLLNSSAIVLNILIDTFSSEISRTDPFINNNQLNTVFVDYVLRVSNSLFLNYHLIYLDKYILFFNQLFTKNINPKNISNSSDLIRIFTLYHDLKSINGLQRKRGYYINLMRTYHSTMKQLEENLIIKSHKLSMTESQLILNFLQDLDNPNCGLHIAIYLLKFKNISHNEEMVNKYLQNSCNVQVIVDFLTTVSLFTKRVNDSVIYEMVLKNTCPIILKNITDSDYPYLKEVFTQYHREIFFGISLMNAWPNLSYLALFFNNSNLFYKHSGEEEAEEGINTDENTEITLSYTKRRLSRRVHSRKQHLDYLNKINTPIYKIEVYENLKTLKALSMLRARHHSLLKESSIYFNNLFNRIINSEEITIINSFYIYSNSLQYLEELDVYDKSICYQAPSICQLLRNIQDNNSVNIAISMVNILHSLCYFQQYSIVSTLVATNIINDYIIPYDSALPTESRFKLDTISLLTEVELTSKSVLYSPISSELNEMDNRNSYTCMKDYWSNKLSISRIISPHNYESTFDKNKSDEEVINISLYKNTQISPLKKEVIGYLGTIASYINTELTFRGETIVLARFKEEEGEIINLNKSDNNLLDYLKYNVIVEVDDETNFYINRKLWTSQTKIKHRLLNCISCGRVVRVPWWEWKELETNKQKDAYFYKLIKSVQ